MNTPSPRQSKHILLLMTPATYRAGAFINAAKVLNAAVTIGLDTPEALATEHPGTLAISFARLEASVIKIIAYAQEHPLNAIISVDDSAAELAALASTRLGLSHNALDAAEAARDKLIMRRKMHAAGVPCPVFRPFPLTADPEHIAKEVRYPCVVKPLRMNGSRGVIRADNETEFIQAFQRDKRMILSDGYTAEESSLLVEDFIPGFEVALEGLLTAGELQVLDLFEKPDPLDGPFFEETIYITPSRLPESTQLAIADCAARAAASIGLKEGPVHAEMRVNDQGPWMLELAGRSIGGLCSTILEFGSGMSLEEIILRHALGEDPDQVQQMHGAAGVMMIPIPAGGILKGVTGIEEARQVPLITGIEVTAKLNYSVVPLPEGNSYLGFIFARGETPQAIEAAIRDAHSKLTFDIRKELVVIPAPLPSHGV